MVILKTAVRVFKTVLSRKDRRVTSIVEQESVYKNCAKVQEKLDLVYKDWEQLAKKLEMRTRMT